MKQKKIDNIKEQIKELWSIDTKDIAINTTNLFCFSCDKEKKQYIFQNKEKQIFAMIDDCEHGHQYIFYDGGRLK